MEFLAVYTVGRWGLQTILPPSSSVIFGVGRGHFIYALYSENRHQTYIHANILYGSLTHCYVIHNLKQIAVYDTRYAVTQQHSGKVTWHTDFCDKCFPELKYKSDSKLQGS